MNPEIKASWVEALRSEEYKQGANALHRNGTFCCLGVLCDLAVKAGAAKVFDLDLDLGAKNTYYGSTVDDSNAYLLPRVVQEWAGLNSDSPFAGDFELTVLNDNGVSFKDIADVIEEQF